MERITTWAFAELAARKTIDEAEWEKQRPPTGGLPLGPDTCESVSGRVDYSVQSLPGGGTEFRTRVLDRGSLAARVTKIAAETLMLDELGLTALVTGSTRIKKVYEVLCLQLSL